jgi:hypothetical protein
LEPAFFDKPVYAVELVLDQFIGDDLRLYLVWESVAGHLFGSAALVFAVCSGQPDSQFVFHDVRVVFAG